MGMKYDKKSSDGSIGLSLLGREQNLKLYIAL